MIAFILAGIVLFFSIRYIIRVFIRENKRIDVIIAEHEKDLFDVRFLVRNGIHPNLLHEDK